MLLIGKITGVHGVRGMLKALPFADNPEDLLHLPTWLLKHPNETGQFHLESAKVYQTKGLLLKLKGIDSPEAGRHWVGAEVLVDRADLPPLEQGHYWADLEGLAVYTVEGMYLGRVSHLFETGANDVMVVKDGETERLVPYVAGHVVVDVNIAEGRLTVEWEP